MIHLILIEERRVSTPEKPRELAIQVTSFLPQVSQGKEAISTLTQLHMLSEVIAFDNVIYAAEWDGVSPYLTVLIGDVKDVNMTYAGWPMSVAPVVNPL
jgi:hypothetical protein